MKIKHSISQTLTLRDSAPLRDKNHTFIHQRQFFGLSTLNLDS
ncbi:hypothetical protein VB638_03470 [Dolichospermum sp. UHCC 0684]|nr:hypothetical protein [Dolichospermum sp. UHCC 0406]MEA5528655.1 hypothetical protein [Dolichospermum sp. UHCC 0684]